MLFSVHRNVIRKRQVLRNYGTIRIQKKTFWKIFKIPRNSCQEFHGYADSRESRMGIPCGPDWRGGEEFSNLNCKLKKQKWIRFTYILHCFEIIRLFYQTTTHTTITVLRPFFPGPPGWAGARRELLDFMVQGKINRGDTPTIRTNQCPPPPSPIFFTGWMPFLPPNQQCQSTEGNMHWGLFYCA